MNEIPKNYETEARNELAKMPGAEIVIFDQSSYEQAGEILRNIATVKKEIKAKFAEPKEKAHEAHKAICDLEKELLTKVTERENEIRQKMSIYYQAEQKRIAAEEERKRQEAERLMQTAVEAEAAGDTETAETYTALAAMSEATVTVAPKAAGVSFREVWKAKVVDESKVPREYLIVNQTALDAVAKATKGSIKIAGVEFVKELVSSVRSK